MYVPEAGFLLLTFNCDFVLQLFKQFFAICAGVAVENKKQVCFWDKETWKWRKSTYKFNYFLLFYDILKLYDFKVTFYLNLFISQSFFHFYASALAYPSFCLCRKNASAFSSSVENHCKSSSLEYRWASFFIRPSFFLLCLLLDGILLYQMTTLLVQPTLILPQFPCVKRSMVCCVHFPCFLFVERRKTFGWKLKLWKKSWNYIRFFFATLLCRTVFKQDRHFLGGENAKLNKQKEVKICFTFCYVIIFCKMFTLNLPKITFLLVKTPLINIAQRAKWFSKKNIRICKD